jgi:hypothetical protein
MEIFDKACVNLKRISGKAFRQQNFVCSDALFYNCNQKFDIIFGNPPWVNYSSLPQDYREKVRKYYIESGLVKSGRSLLLGDSQVNIAALIVFRVISDFMKKNAEAVLFMPLSVVFNSGAHRAFSGGNAGKTRFCIDEIMDLSGTDAFPGISTQYGLLRISTTRKQVFPVSFLSFQPETNTWKNQEVVKLHNKQGPLCVVNSDEKKPRFRKISLPEASKPRQGLNTCGANDVYFFDSCEKKRNGICVVSNTNGIFELPEEFIFPLIHRDHFCLNTLAERKYVLIPYNSNGKPLNKSEMKNIRLLWEYFQKFRNRLELRRGLYIGKFIEKGLFWALLGVGNYNFFNYKIVWQACGSRHFNPIIFTGRWQANQALHAYLPFTEKRQCEKVYKKLKTAEIESILESLHLGGTKCYGQPGVISHFFEFI